MGRRTSESIFLLAEPGAFSVNREAPRDIQLFANIQDNITLRENAREDKALAGVTEP